jgi:hypothetical protein
MGTLTIKNIKFEFQKPKKSSRRSSRRGKSHKTNKWHEEQQNKKVKRSSN